MIRVLPRLSCPSKRHATPYCGSLPRLHAIAATSSAACPRTTSRFESCAASQRQDQDASLRLVFDSASFWRNFTSPTLADSLKPSKGLFQNQYLTQPSGFLRFARDIQSKCQDIVAQVLRAASVEEYKALPKHLDLLSDCLCRVLDVSEFVRATHPNDSFQQGAAQAYAFLWEYMNILNTTPGLHSQLATAMSDPDVVSSWTQEETTVAQILLKDFSNSAIHLPQRERRKFVDLSNHMKQLSNSFLENMAPATPNLEFDSSQIRFVDPTLSRQLPGRSGKVFLPIAGDEAYRALQSVPDESVRQSIYTAGRQTPQSQIQCLEQLMKTRLAIAKLSEYASYAEMTLADKMAKSPEAVTSFLTALSLDNAAYVKQELIQIQDLKRGDGLASRVAPWDVTYYRNRLNAYAQSKSRKPDFLSAYFSLGIVMQGLSRLFNRLYGIRFVPRETHPGEVWAPDVRRLDAVHETEGLVAVLYCDLFSRPGKLPHPAHFTLRCSRRKDSPSEVDDIADGMATVLSPSTKELYQLPTIALVCDFSHANGVQSPTLLTLRELQTLFHEMGHAVHSILGRTSLQVISGTRVATDFAELPSVLMESFATDASVLGLYARHWETDAPLPFNMVEDALAGHKRGQGLQTETQILYSLLDQAYHSELPSEWDTTGGSKSDSSKVLLDIYDRYSSLREPRGSSAQGFFGHLVEYGGTYYSYLFDRAIAGRLWQQVFDGGKNNGAINREAGEKYKEEVLRWGGGRSGWACVGGLLGDGKVKEGGKAAMEEVGRWGVHD